MHVETSVVIDRPIDEVWAFVTDPFNLPRLGGGTLALRQTSSGPIGLGSTAQARLVILGFESRISGVITEWDPPRAVTFSATGAGLRSVSLRAILEPTAAGTKVVRSGDVEPRSAFRPLLWFLWPFTRRRALAAAQNMKRLLEAGEGEPRGSIDAH